MSMQTTLTLILPTVLFELEEAEQAERLAEDTDAAIYCWKTSGSSNWLEKGLSVSDVLGLVVLPSQFPEVIDMPDDTNDD